MDRVRIVAFVSNPFSHDPRVRRESLALQEAGFEVHVVGFDPQGTFPEKEDFHGITVHRLRRSNVLKIPYSAFLSRPAWWFEAWRLGKKLMTKRTIIQCHDFDTLPIGISLRKRAEAVVFDAHEIWIEMAAEHFSPRLQRAMRKWEHRMVRKVDRVVTVNEPLRAYYAKVHQKDPLIVMNCKEVDPRWSPPTEDQFTVVYIGTMSEMRQVHLLIEAVENLHDVRLIIAGGGDMDYIRRIQAMADERSNVEYLGVLPEEAVLQWTRRAHLVALPIDPENENQRKALANKQFEAMAVGRPIVVSEDCYSADFLREHEVGLVAEHSVDGFREAIELLKNDPELYNQFAKRAFVLAKNQFNWPSQAALLISCMEGLVQSN